VQGDEIAYLKDNLAWFKIRGPQLTAPPAGTRVRSAAVNNLVAFYEGSGTRGKASGNPAGFVVLHNAYRHPLKPTAPDIHVILEELKGTAGQRPDPARTTDTTVIFVAGNLGPLRPRADSANGPACARTSPQTWSQSSGASGHPLMLHRWTCCRPKRSRRSCSRMPAGHSRAATPPTNVSCASIVLAPDASS